MCRIDIRATELVPTDIEAADEDDETTEAAFTERLWIFQCKGEKTLPPKRLRAVIKDSWSSDALLVKAQRYAELMLEHAKDDWRFALWSSFALELLLRASLARISPTLLADNRADWNNVYYALGQKPTAKQFRPQSIGVAEVANRLAAVMPSFTPEMRDFCIGHMTTRNEELHTGVVCRTGRAGLAQSVLCCVRRAAAVLGKSFFRVFVTAHDEYALRAFDVCAVDFLVKPVTPDRLARALARLRDRDAHRRLTELVAHLRRSRPLERIVGKRQHEFQVIPVEAIEAFVAEQELVFAISTTAGWADDQHQSVVCAATA